jgi:hypothetical protein
MISTNHVYIKLNKNAFEGRYADNFAVEDFSVFLNKKGIELCAMSSSNSKKVEGNAFFQDADEYIKNYVPTDDDIRGLISHRTMNIDEINLLLDVDTTKIEDPFLVEMINKYKKYHALPSVFLTRMLAPVVSQIPECKDFFEKDRQLKKLIDERYPLLKRCINDGNDAREIVFYINAKHKMEGNE